MIARGEVYWVNLDPTLGSELRKRRACVVVQRDVATQNSPITIVCPLTDAAGRQGNLLNVFVAAGTGGTTKDSLVVCNQVRAVDKSRIQDRLGVLPPDCMAAINRGLTAILDL
ncbi:MAG: type II toxin-antitoxin system PemK/MazF family toxin [Candidatus Velthaea sp.]